MSRDFSRIKVFRISRKNSLKRQHSKKRNFAQQHFKTTQSNVTHQSRLKNTCFSNVSVSRSASISNTTKAISNSKQNRIKHQGQNTKIAVESDPSNLFDCTRDSLPINSINNSITCFDLFNTHRSLRRNHRITPINCRDLFENDFTLDINERNRKKKKNKKKYNLSLCKIGVCILILLLVIGGIIGLVIYAMNQSKNLETTTISSIITTTQNSVCTTGGITCPTPMFAWNRIHNCTKPAASYIYYTCCYQAVSTQLTIEFILREDVSNWYIDDVSITQGSSELLINGGFESNLTGWTATSSIGNLSVTPVAMYSPGAAHFNSSVYLYSEAKSTSDHIKQTVNVIQGQNVNISFWWLDEGGIAGPTEICEATVTLTP